MKQTKRSKCFLTLTALSLITVMIPKNLTHLMQQSNVSMHCKTKKMEKHLLPLLLRQSFRNILLRQKYANFVYVFIVAIITSLQEKLTVFKVMDPILTMLPIFHE